MDVVRAMIERVAFRDIRSNGYRGSRELRGKTVSLDDGKLRDESIH
jgi:hypothetical protein